MTSPAPAVDFEVPLPAGHTAVRQVAVDGTTVGLRRAGSGAPVLFLHGHWATRRWLPFHEQLAAGADVLAPEHPGFGETLSPAWIGDRSDVVLLYRDLLDALVLPRVHLVGYGLGGWLAADLAVWFPERVASLSLLAPYGLRVEGHPLANIFLMNPATFPTAYGLPAGSELVPGVGTPDQGGPQEWAQRYGEMGAAARLMWQRRYDLALETRLPRLAARGLPALVVGGEDDQVLPPPHLARWSELLDASTVLVPGGHAFPYTSPQETAAAVSTFVSDQEAAR